MGEPPLFLASSIYFAIKDAIRSARIEAGVSPHFDLQVPATCARIRMACEDEITKQVNFFFIKVFVYQFLSHISNSHAVCKLRLSFLRQPA